MHAAPITTRTTVRDEFARVAEIHAARAPRKLPPGVISDEIATQRLAQRVRQSRALDRLAQRERDARSRGVRPTISARFTVPGSRTTYRQPNITLGEVYYARTTTRFHRVTDAVATSDVAIGNHTDGGTRKYKRASDGITKHLTYDRALLVDRMASQWAETVADRLAINQRARHIRASNSNKQRGN